MEKLIYCFIIGSSPLIIIINKMSFHNLIYDASQIQQFSQLFHNDIVSPYCALVYLCARTKYDSSISDQKVVDRKYITQTFDTNDPNFFVRIVQRYCCPIGSYLDSKGNTIQDKALAIYAGVNLHDTTKGFQQTITAYQTLNETVINSIVKNKETSDKSLSDRQYFLQHVVSKLKSNIQKYTNNKYLHVDMDSKEKEHIRYCVEILSKNNVVPDTIIETKNGYHILMNTKNLAEKNKPIRDAFTKKGLFHVVGKTGLQHSDYVFTITTGCSAVPLPGTLQGGFEVRFVDWWSYCLKTVS